MGLIALDIFIVAGVSIGVGAVAPRISGRFLRSDPFLLKRFPWESPAFFRSLRVAQLARTLPDMGATFGGESKSNVPGRTPADLDHYLVELRRAEWVHWISIVSWVPLAFFNPWWVTMLFAVIVISGNTMFLLILRRNRQRLIALKRRLQNDT